MAKISSAKRVLNIDTKINAGLSHTSHIYSRKIDGIKGDKYHLLSILTSPLYAFLKLQTTTNHPRHLPFTITLPPASSSSDPEVHKHVQPLLSHPRPSRCGHRSIQPAESTK